MKTATGSHPENRATVSNAETAGKAAIAGIPTTVETAFPNPEKVEKEEKVAEKAEKVAEKAAKAEKAEKVEIAEDHHHRYAFPGATRGGAIEAIGASSTTQETHLDQLSEAKR
jgi:hypothetical protein